MAEQVEVLGAEDTVHLLFGVQAGGAVPAGVTLDDHLYFLLHFDLGC